MEEEYKALKQIVWHSAEGAPDGFTDAVMKKVSCLSATPFSYQPLVPPKIVTGFLIGAAVVVGVILVLCLSISLPHLPYLDPVAEGPRTQKAWNHIVTFLLCFWFVFAVNRLLEKHTGLSRNSMLF